MPIDRWMDKEDICTHNGISFSHKEEWNSAICNNMDGPGDYHTKWSKSDRERQIYDITCMWNLKNNTNELIYKTETDSQTYKTNLRFKGKRVGRDKSGVWD